MYICIYIYIYIYYTCKHLAYTARCFISPYRNFTENPWISWEISESKTRRADNQLLRQRGHTTATATAWSYGTMWAIFSEDIP